MQRNQNICCSTSQILIWSRMEFHLYNILVSFIHSQTQRASQTFSQSSLHSIPAAVSMIENSYSKYFENCFIMDRLWSFAALHCTLRVCSLLQCEVFRGLCQLVMSISLFASGILFIQHYKFKYEM